MAQAPKGVFVPSTFVWDVDQVKQTEVTSPQFKELMVRLYENINDITLALNVKDTGLYDTQEVANGQLYFSNPVLNSSTSQTPTPRQVIRKVINFGALPDTSTKSVGHGISCTTSTRFTRIYATATKPTVAFSYLPIPYASAVAANIIELYVDATNVNIVTGSNYSAWTNTFVVLEYLYF